MVCLLLWLDYFLAGTEQAADGCLGCNDANSEVIQLGDRQVCFSCKNYYVQRMVEWAE